jgi:hypothetical protein
MKMNITGNNKIKSLGKKIPILEQIIKNICDL